MDSPTSVVNEPSHTSRRDFCTDLLLTSTALVLATPAATKGAAAQQAMIDYPPRKIEGAEALLPGSSLYFVYPTRNDPAVLLRSSEGEFKAFSRRCSHAGCSVEFDRSARCLSCPCHKGAYDVRMGRVIFGPPRTPLDEIFLEIRSGGQIWAIGKTFGRDSEMIARSPQRR